MDLSVRDRTLLTSIAVLLLVFLAFQVAVYVVEALRQVADVLLIFLVAWALAYVLVPIVDLLERRTPLRRLGSVTVVYLAILIVLGVVLAFGVPALALQLAAVAQRGPEYGQRAAAFVTDLQDQLNGAGFKVDLTPFYGTIPGRLAEITGSLATNALGVITTTGTILLDVTVVLIVAFFMLLDGEKLWQRFISVLSEELRSEAELFRLSADRSFGGFLRASLMLGTLYAVMTFLVLGPLGVPFAGLLAVLSGVVLIIPFFGPTISLIPVAATTALGAPDRFLVALVALIVLQQIVINVIGPRLMSGAIGIHPLFVFFALLLGAQLAGFWGVLLAVPVAGMVNTFVHYAYQVWRGRRVRTEAHLIHG
ncbi:MAG: AI-2E family transporter [Chloroflexota bacterium]|nr:AI-2E family transporter [Chloroflexota bacterium]